jgi:hypothetical protein
MDYSKELEIAPEEAIQYTKNAIAVFQELSDALSVIEPIPADSTDEDKKWFEAARKADKEFLEKEYANLMRVVENCKRIVISKIQSDISKYGKSA